MKRLFKLLLISYSILVLSGCYGYRHGHGHRYGYGYAAGHGYHSVHAYSRGPNYSYGYGPRRGCIANIYYDAPASAIR